MLIDAVKIANRYLFRKYGTENIPTGGVYSRDPVHLTSDAYRAAVGDWAGELLLAFFYARKKQA